MSKRSIVHTPALLVAVLLAVDLGAGCSGRAPIEGEGEVVGAVELGLNIAPGVSIDTVQYSITGNGITPINGAVNVRADGSTVAPIIGGLTEGRYVAELHTLSNDGRTSCQGNGQFMIRRRVTLRITVILDCRQIPPGAVFTGAVSIGAVFNNCPVLSSYTVSAGTTPVQTPVAVTASASDPDPDTMLTYNWESLDGGTFQPPDASNATFMCDSPGSKRLRLTVSDGRCATQTLLVPLACTATAMCGNGVVEPGETCEPPSTATCNEACQLRSPPPPACDACVAANCAAEGPGCASLPPSSPRRAICDSLFQCARRTNCAAENAAWCWCGTTAIPICVTVPGAANGACLAEELAAAESTDPATIARRFSDGSFASGAVHNRLACEADLCANECRSR